MPPDPVVALDAPAPCGVAVAAWQGSSGLVVDGVLGWPDVLKDLAVLERRGVAVPVEDRARHLRWIRLSLASLVATVPAFVVLFGGFLDLHVYRTGGYAWLHGVGLYSERFPDLVPGMRLPFTYPPFAAILFAPMSLLPWQVAKAVLTLVSVLALLATALVVAGRLHGRTSRAVVVACAVTAAWFAFEPVRQTVGFGQVNLILMALVTLDCLLPRTRWPRGLLIGLAAAVKLTPAVFVLFFLVRRQYRAAVVAVGSFVGFGLLGLALAPSDTVTYWFDSLLDPERIGGLAYAFNQCFRGVLHRFVADTPAESVLWIGLVAASGAVAWVAARRARSDVVALLVVAVWGLLASPVSWSHHWVWVVPAALVLAPVAARAGTAVRVALAVAALVFVVGPHAHLPQTGDVEMRWTWWQHLLGSSYVLAAVAFLVVLAVRPLPTQRLSATRN
ncbi:alpha-1,2-mannosyltransferase [Amycolatopsis arida]|uniref:Alpha-1,2-mannosyltransferase n=1 Tax=Amycolatopsis arida TaxID=587909 RepID=A0A1I5SYM1_9PSEU|nr:glycosyltransferase 87 family protein [Amycolatopsis arida]TDX96314.1 alpha-1,2-mannosyltransferase [Amycolatopsis arida]SFP75316.1 alpha-1,2-mannosyltransferase [Amycolatopsis arida]